MDRAADNPFATKRATADMQIDAEPITREQVLVNSVSTSLLSDPMMKPRKKTIIERYVTNQQITSHSNPYTHDNYGTNDMPAR